MEEGSQALLSPDEIARALRFHFEKDRLHFTGCRSALRGLLAKYLAIPAAEIRFEYTTSGKPRLAAAQNPSALQFNVSHSAGMALIAIGSEHRLGIDIEKIRENVDVSALSERFFSLRERVGLRALPNHLRVPGFFACFPSPPTPSSIPKSKKSGETPKPANSGPSPTYAWSMAIVRLWPSKTRFLLCTPIPTSALRSPRLRPGWKSSSISRQLLGVI
jgi:hypothetical protein